MYLRASSRVGGHEQWNEAWMSFHIDAVAAMTERCEIFDAMSEANTWRDAIRLHGLAPSEEQDRACLSTLVPDRCGLGFFLLSSV